MKFFDRLVDRTAARRAAAFLRELTPIFAGIAKPDGFELAQALHDTAVCGAPASVTVTWQADGTLSLARRAGEAPIGTPHVCEIGEQSVLSHLAFALLFAVWQRPPRASKN